MSSYDESKHPRGHSSNPGRFSEKANSEPEATLAAPRTTSEIRLAAVDAYMQAERVSELAAAKEISEAILAAVPDAKYVTLDTSDLPNGFYPDKLYGDNDELLGEWEMDDVFLTGADEPVEGLGYDNEALFRELPQSARYRTVPTAPATSGGVVIAESFRTEPDPAYDFFETDPASRFPRLNLRTAAAIDLGE